MKNNEIVKAMRTTESRSNLDLLDAAADLIGKLAERCARYAAYEDTWLEPEEVSALVKDWSDLCTIVGECGGVARLRELAEADKDGRLVVLPCKVGDTLFRVFAGEILEHKVGNMRYLAIHGRWDIETYPFCPYMESSIGKTIFLTREEAEAALEAMKDD